MSENRLTNALNVLATALTVARLGQLLWADWRQHHPKPVVVEPEPGELPGWGEAHRQLSDELRALEAGPA